jgi:hypothetical protein
LINTKSILASDNCEKYFTEAGQKINSFGPFAFKKPNRNEILKIIKGLEIYPEIKKNCTHLKCVNFSEIVHKALSKEGIRTIQVTSEDSRGYLVHNYLLVQSNEGILIIDPTANQFVKFPDAFIGSRDELLSFVKSKKLPHQEDPSYNWSSTPLLIPKIQNPPSTSELEQFNKLWGAANVIYYKDFSVQYAQWIFEAKSRGVDWRNQLNNSQFSPNMIKKIEDLVLKLEEKAK